MRNRFFLITIFFCFVPWLFASNPKDKTTRYYRHELNIGAWIGHHAGWIEDNSGVMEGQFRQILGYNHFDVHWNTTMGAHPENGLIAVNYFYHINHHIAVGIFGGRQSVCDKLSYTTTDYIQGEIPKITIGNFEEGWSSWFLMPSVKWTWLNNHWCSLYSKATGGLHYQNLHLESAEIPKDQTGGFKKTHKDFSYYITPIGWEIGARNVRWFMEGSFIGTNKNFQMGLMYRFGRY